MLAAAVAAGGIILSHSDTQKALRDARDLADRQHEDTLKALAKTDAAIEQTRRLADAAGQSAETAKNVFVTDQRPWVAVAPHIVSDLKWDTNGDARVTVDILTENTGKTPAVNIDVSAEFVVLKLDDPRPYQKRLCDPIRTRVQSPWSIGEILFPAHPEHYLWNLPISHSAIEEFNTWEAKAFGLSDNERRKNFHPALIGCVDYKFTFAEGHHQTGFINDLFRDGMGGIYVGEAVSKERLTLYRSDLSVPPD